MASLPAGVAVSGATLTAGMIGYAAAVRAALDRSVPLTITSGYRSPTEQATAMLYKLSQKGEKELYAVYQDDGLIQALLSTPRNAAAWAVVIATKGATLSRHLRGGAFDLRIRGLSTAQVSAMKDAVVRTGGRALLEFDHLHVDLPRSYAAQSGLEAAGRGLIQTAKTSLAVWAIASVVGLGILGAVLLYQRRRKAPARIEGDRKEAARANPDLSEKLDNVYFGVTAYAPAKSLLRYQADDLLERAGRRPYVTHGDVRRMQEMRELAERQYGRRNRGMRRKGRNS